MLRWSPRWTRCSLPPPSGCGELWKPITGHPDCYISWFGRVVGPRGKVLKPSPRGNYVRVSLGGRSYNIHVLVLREFVGPRPKGLLSRHLNGDSRDNWLGNLAYGTHAENMDDRRAHGRNWNANKTECPAGHEYTPENTYWWGTKNRRRMCRTCQLDRVRSRRKSLT